MHDIPGCIWVLGCFGFLFMTGVCVNGEEKLRERGGWEGFHFLYAFFF